MGGAAPRGPAYPGNLSNQPRERTTRFFCASQKLVVTWPWRPSGVLNSATIQKNEPLEAVWITDDRELICRKGFERYFILWPGDYLVDGNQEDR